MDIEKIISRAFDVAVVSGTGISFAGAGFDKPLLMYGALVGTFITTIAGAHYNDTTERRVEKRAIKYLL